MPDGTPQTLVPLALERPAAVRVATQADEAALFALLWDHLYADNGMGIAPDAAKVWGYVNATCRGQGGVAGVVDGPDGTLIGSVGIVACQPWYSEVWNLAEMWLFVHPLHRRRTGHGQALFDFARWPRADMSARLGYAVGLEISILSFKRVRAKERLWERNALRVGATFWIDGDHHGR